MSERSACVAGAGTMGAGIALALARGGWAVDLVSRRETTLEAARRRIGAAADWLGAEGGEDAGALAAAVGRIRTATSLDGLGGWQLVVETVAERADVKAPLLERLERQASGDALVTTNTSSLPIADLARAVRRPERFLGMHWLNPPELAELVELVAGPQTEAAALERAAAWCAELGKVAIRVRRDVPGFIVNRLQYALFREAFALVETGVCSYDDVDRAMTAGLGPRWAVVGPFESLDLAGLDVYETVAQRLYPELSCATEPAPAARELVAAGALGCKTGRGLLGRHEPDAVARAVRHRDASLLASARERGKRTT